MTASPSPALAPLPRPGAFLEIVKPVTWFPPVWAYLCGVVSVGGAGDGAGGGAARGALDQWGIVLLGLFLAGPLVCGMSQAANDWCDRHVDAINEPGRAIPSGRMPGRWGLWTALAMTGLSLACGAALGSWGFLATCAGVAAAWAYSAEPLRLKRSGVWGPGLVGLCYEGLPWITGAAVLSAGAPPWPVVALAVLYSLGAHGIMTLNDFKAIRGDRLTGIASLPVTLGPERAALVACAVMLAAQGAVIGCLAAWDRPIHAAAVAALTLAQVAAMRVLLRDPAAKAPWYNGAGVTLYVAGMMVAAFALRSLG